MKLAIVGSRGFSNYELLKETLKKYNIDVIVSGGAEGADSLAEKYALDNNIPLIIFLPDWKQKGKKAGFLRNIKIVEACDGLIAFWDGESRGTKHSIDLAKKNYKFLEIVYDK